MTHQYGHGKAEHLTALAEAAFLSAVSVLIAVRALERLLGSSHPHVHATWYALVVVVVVIAVDVSRLTASRRASRRYRSAAFAANALHFAGDLAGSFAVLGGLLLARSGYPGRGLDRGALRRRARARRGGAARPGRTSTC